MMSVTRVSKRSTGELAAGKLRDTAAIPELCHPPPQPLGSAHWKMEPLRERCSIIVKMIGKALLNLIYRTGGATASVLLGVCSPSSRHGTSAVSVV
jgi:hypothetical protein